MMAAMKTALFAAILCAASVSACAKDNNPFSGARSFEISLTKEARDERPKRKVYRPPRGRAAK